LLPVKPSVLKQLIIHADDFGLTPGVTRGILETHAAGIVTSTSVMIGTPGWPDAAAHLRQPITLDVGLHFNLLVGRPLTSAPTITDRRTGAFLRLPVLVARALAGRLDPHELRAECTAQLRALQETGASVTHIDSHRHTHPLPGVWSAIQAVAADAGLFVRIPAEPWRTARTPSLAAQLHRAAVSASAWRPTATKRVQFTGLTLDGARDFEAGLLRTLDGLSPGVTELMVHPGYVEPALAAVDGYTWQRVRELAALLSPAVATRLHRGDISLTSFAYI
jgi:PTS system cellobiose-specific IIA component